MSLTELTIKNLKPKTKSYRIADSGGLCIEVSPSGGKLWRWRYRHQGKEQMLALGKYPATSLAEARKLRDQARDQADKGKHLTREKKAQKLRQAYVGENTFEKIANEWHEIKKEGLNKKYHADRLTRFERVVFPKIGNLPITEISIPDIVGIIQSIGKTGTIETANRVKMDIRQVFRYATHKGICSNNPASDIKDILPKKVKKHHACIHPNKFPELLSDIANCENNMSKYAMELLTLTFVRTQELIGARWEEIKWDKKEWHIPKERMKMRRPHVVPLSRQAILVLRKIETETSDTPFVFYSSGSKSKHISNCSILMALRRMKYSGKMTGHGFRTLASTILNERGYNRDVIERQLAHEDRNQVRAAYNRAEYLPERKRMMQDYADLLDSFVIRISIHLN